jgi:hypothetical protein
MAAPLKFAHRTATPAQCSAMLKFQMRGVALRHHEGGSGAGLGAWHATLEVKEQNKPNDVFEG